MEDNYLYLYEFDKVFTRELQEEKVIEAFRNDSVKYLIQLSKENKEVLFVIGEPTDINTFSYMYVLCGTQQFVRDLELYLMKYEEQVKGYIEEEHLCAVCDSKDKIFRSCISKVVVINNGTFKVAEVSLWLD